MMANTFNNTTFSNFVTLQRGFDLPKQHRELGVFPVVASTSIQDYHTEYKVRPPGVVTGRSGSLGSVQYLQVPFWPLNTTLWVKDFKGNDPKFVFYFLQTLGLQRYNSGAGVPTLNRNHLDGLDVATPPLPTQQKIAAILSAYDDLIENNLRRIKIQEEMAQNLYREWFVKFRFPGHQHARVTDSPLGRIPEGWETKKVGEILKKVKRGEKIQKQDYAAEGSIPVVDQGKEFLGGYTDNRESLIFEDLPLIVFGDHTRALKFIDFPFACGADGTQLLKSNDERMPMTLFYYALSSIDLSDFAYARHFKFMKEETLVLPEKSIADLFDQFVSPLREQTRSLMKKNTTLRRTRDLLLPRLISGEVDVSELDITVLEEAE
jgi:type I restriction enzyme, S subunit